MQEMKRAGGERGCRGEGVRVREMSLLDFGEGLTEGVPGCVEWVKVGGIYKVGQGMGLAILDELALLPVMVGQRIARQRVATPSAHLVEPQQRPHNPPLLPLFVQQLLTLHPSNTEHPLPPHQDRLDLITSVVARPQARDPFSAKKLAIQQQASFARRSLGFVWRGEGRERGSTPWDGQRVVFDACEGEDELECAEIETKCNVTAHQGIGRIV